MCGIVGYTGDRAAAPILLDGLKKLEYRGYDSAGLAIMSESGINVQKVTGRIQNLCERTDDGAKLPGTTGIGHTRWATHGAPTEENAHPHLSNDGRFAIVHNGIIENYIALREELIKGGYSFESETDTEVINGFFTKKAGLYHYVSTAKKNYREYLHGETVRLKKYFYVIRPLLACRWILKHGTPPPMLFDELAADCLDPELKPAVDKLLQMKRETPELGEGPRIGVINDYIDRSLEEIGAVIAELPEEGSGSWELLNSLFLAIVNAETL